MGKIYVVKRRSGVEHYIPVWNLGGFIETEQMIERRVEGTAEELAYLDGVLSVI